MGYYSEVTMLKVVCRNPESITTADRFAMVCVVTTDRGPDGRIEGKDVYLSPLRLLRKNEYAWFHDTIFKGFSTEPKIGFVLRAWDQDPNSKRVAFKEDYDKIKEDITGHLDEYPAAGEILGVGVDILKFAADYIVTAVDWFVSDDNDDELVNYSTWIDLSDASFEPSKPGVGPLVVDSPRSGQPGGRPFVTNWTVEGLQEKKAWTSELLAGPSVSPYLIRQQVGPDLVRLNNQVVIEIYRILHGDTTDVGDRGLRFIRPVSNVLYRDTGFQVQAYLRFKVV
jgi:hypothetical protein